MKRSLIHIFGAGVLAAGLALAQTPSTGAQQSGTQQGQPRRARMFHRLATYLNLTDAQQAEAKDIFKAAGQQAKPVRQQLHDVRAQLADAVKSNAPAGQVQQLSNNAGSLMAQLTAIRTQAFQKFYTTLTPDQKTKMDARMDHLLNAHGRGMHARHAKPANS